jgi:hypothetical protein
MLDNEVLSKLKSSEVQVSELEVPPSFGTAPVQIIFAGGASLKADYWRLMQGGKALISSFDHNQKYGLPEPVNAIEELRTVLNGKNLTNCEIDRETGDLYFRFSDSVRLHIFNVSSYEVWEVTFPNGTSEYSNYNK